MVPPNSDDWLSILGALASTLRVSVTAPGFNVTLSAVVELIVIRTPLLATVAKPGADTVTSYLPMANSEKR